MKLLRNALFFTLLPLAQAALGCQYTELKKEAESAFNDTELKKEAESAFNDFLLNLDREQKTATKHALQTLFEYIKTGDLQKVSEFLKRKPSLINALQNEKTLLTVAITNGNLKAVQLLIDAGADVNKRGSYAKDPDLGWTPLCLAVHFEHYEIVKLLIEKKADINIPTNTDEESNGTPLGLATLKNNIEMVKLLIQHNADVNKAAYNGAATPLLEAAGLGYAEIVKLLLTAGANIHLANDTVDDGEGNIPLVAAAESGHIKVLEILLSKNADINEKAPNGLTALTAATENGQPETIQFLLKHKADINKTTNTGLTALAIATQKNKPEIVKLLLAHGADVNHAVIDGVNRPLYIAIENNYQEIIEILINAKANLEQVLFVAAQQGNCDIVKFLIAKGVNINEQWAFDKGTALHTAIAHNHVAIAKTLILAGANIKIRDKFSAIPLTWACLKNNRQIIRLLLGIKSNISQRDLGNDNIIAQLDQHMSSQTKRLFNNAVSGENQKLFTAIRNNDPVAVKTIIAKAIPHTKPVKVQGIRDIYIFDTASEEKEHKEQAETSTHKKVFWKNPLHIALENYTKHTQIDKKTGEQKYTPDEIQKSLKIIHILDHVNPSLWDIPDSDGKTPLDLVLTQGERYKDIVTLLRKIVLGSFAYKEAEKSTKQALDAINCLGDTKISLWNVANALTKTPLEKVIPKDEKIALELIKKISPLIPQVSSSSSSASTSEVAASSSSSAPALAVTASPTSSVLGKRKAPHTSPEKDDEQSADKKHKSE